MEAPPPDLGPPKLGTPDLELGTPDLGPEPWPCAEAGGGTRKEEGPGGRRNRVGAFQSIFSYLILSTPRG